MKKAEPKVHRLRFAAKNKKTWDFIKSGEKQVETRAGTVKYLRVQKGDTLIMCCGKNHLEKKVKSVKHFKTISALIKIYPPGIINPGTTTLKEMEAMYYSYPGYKEKIKEFGILAFEI